MAEYCLDCWNKINGTNDKPIKWIFDRDYCDGCGEWKKTIVASRYARWKRRLKPFWLPLYIVWRIMILPYSIYQQIKLFKE